MKETKNKKLEEYFKTNPRLKKALAYVGRIEILKSIAEKSRYCEELAMERNCAAPGVFRHCRQLENANLIESYKTDENERNVMYKLTDYGRKILKILSDREQS